MIHGSHLPRPPDAAAAVFVAAAEAVAAPAPTVAAAPVSAPPSNARPSPTSELTSAGKTLGTVPPGVKCEISMGSNAPMAEVALSRGSPRRETTVDSKPPPAPNIDSTCELLGTCGVVVLPSQLCTMPSRPELLSRSSIPDRPPVAGLVM